MAVSPNTGKTAGKHARVIFDETDLSGDARQIGNMGYERDRLLVSGAFQEMKYDLLGQQRNVFDGFQAVFSNTAQAAGATPIQAGSHTELSDLESYIISVPIGIRSAPAIGNPALAGIWQQKSYITQVSNTDVVLINAEFFGDGTSTLNSALWGVVLANGTSLSSTTTNGSVDNLASSANGAVAFLHLTSTVGNPATNNWAVTIEHSTDDSAWSTLITFSANGATLVAERQAVTGTVNRYTRVKATKTAGTDIVPWVTFIRL